MSLRINLGTAFTGSDLPPKSYADPIMGAGTHFLVDFTRADCNPNADGVLPVGALFQDLVAGRGNWDVLRPAGSTVITSLPGKKGLSWPSGARSSANADNVRGAAFPLNGGVPFVSWLWLKMNVDGDTTAYRNILHRAANPGQNANQSTFGMDTGPTGDAPRCQVLPAGAGASVGPQTSAATALTRGQVHMVAMEFVPSTRVSLFHDGAQVLNFTSSVPASLEADAAWRHWLCMPGGGVIYRAGLELSGPAARTGAQLAAAEWALKNGAFT